MVFQVIWEHLSEQLGTDIGTSTSPVEVLNNLEKEKKTQAIKSLKEGLRDFLFMLQDYPKALNSINKKLKAQNLPQTNILISQLRKVPQRVLKNGRIRNLDEYYIVKEVLDDVEYDITSKERNQLNEIFGAFEMNYDK